MNRTDATYSTPQPDLGKKQETPQPAADLQREADRLLLAKYVPAAVVINSQLDILQSRGQASRYLELSPGKASLNLLRMARPGLLFELQRAVDEVAKTNKPVTRDNIQVETSGNRRLLSIEVIPFSVASSSEHHFLVVFHDEAVIGSGTPGHDQGQNAHGDQGKDAHFEQLKEELAAAKEYLQSIIEEREATNQELQAANEEIQSGNEELQSTNEELQTSKEELESANEELNTVNEEMQHRNQQLTLLNNDLTNLLNSVNMPIVMLGPDLGIRRFTMQAEKLLGLSSVDVGRPINKVRMRANISDLEHAVLGVIRDVHPAQLEFRDDDGVAYDLRISPYRTADNKIDGAVLVCLDSRALKASRSQQRKSEQRK